MASQSELREYSQERMVSAISSFYSFLKGMHSESGGMGDFEYPPPEGWPHITKNLFPGNTDRVIELIRHLPYYDDKSFLVMPDTPLLALGAPSNCVALERELRRKGEEGCEDISTKDGVDIVDKSTGSRFPPHIFALAAAGQYGSSILVDTKYNTIIWWKYDNTYLEMPEEFTSKYTVLGCYADYSEDEVGGDEAQCEIDQCGPDAWGIMGAWRPEDFFEMCKDQFRILNWLPVLDESCRGKVIEVSEHQTWEDTELKLKRIMLNPGWPRYGEGGGWDKIRAEAATASMREEEENEEIATRSGTARGASVHEKWKGVINQRRN
ncbi:hypothetical protein ONS96_009576 [Cadophora gregata f. sp. sojae]|nr:hypothetical protein ONS96_009576 [Cadophora gregata f. sp. sojae]